MLNITVIESAYVSQFEYVKDANMLVANWTDLVSNAQTERPNTTKFAVTSEATGRTVWFEHTGSMWERDNEGEPDGWHIWDDLQGTTEDGRTLTLRICSMGVNEVARTDSPKFGFCNDYDRFQSDYDRARQERVRREIEEERAGIDPHGEMSDLEREAHEEMQAEGEMIAREEAEMGGWSAGFSSFIDGHGNGSGRY